EHSGGIVLDKDALRAALFPPALIEYSLPQDDFCQQIMLQVAAYLLSRDRHLRIFLDGRPFSQRYQREQVRTVAGKLGVPLAIIECVCREGTALLRLQRDRDSGAHVAENRDADLYFDVKSRFEPVVEPKLSIDTDQPLITCVQQADQYLATVSST
ncbi:MAG TPA: AAA family ATPase, partial [Terriglobales bacterium]|nr:AAA family ATPase [Terriglobales bacterium]